MKNKIVIIGLIILGFVLATMIIVFLNKEKSPSIDIAQQNIEQPQAQIITGDFSINLPVGWKEISPVTGTLAMAFNANEVVKDLKAQDIGFKSYFAVSPDTLQEKNMDDYFQALKNALSQNVPNVVFTEEQDKIINGKSAHAIEAELTQQEIDFKVLMVVIPGQEKNLWILSFNTLEDNWDEYEEIFYSVADSFVSKK